MKKVLFVLLVINASSTGIASAQQTIIQPDGPKKSESILPASQNKSSSNNSNCSNKGLASSSSKFVIDADGAYPESVDKNAYWTDTLKHRNHSTGLRQDMDYKGGIAIASQDVADNVFIYIVDFHGPDKYPLIGTGDQYDYSSANNAVYSNDAPKVPYMVVKGYENGSIVTITSDSDCQISGTYDLHLYMDGNKKNSPLKLSGSFNSLPYKKK